LWSEWLHLLEHSYNSSVHSSTGYCPYQLLYRFTPSGLLDLANPRSKRMQLLRANCDNIDGFLQDLEIHQNMACNAIAAAQNKQASAHNTDRRMREFKDGDLVLVNPHLLEWLKSEGKGKKLCQQWIGPFKVLD
jgi:hypothetical protein